MNTHTHTHTPGPWSASINSRPLYTSAEIYGPPNGFGMVSEIRASFGTDDEKAANARLIASAPELLEALKRLVFETSHLIHGDGRNGAIVANEIKNACVTLSKAEGRA